MNLRISFSILREKGFLSAVYVEDSYFQGDDYKDCFSGILNKIEILDILDSRSTQKNPGSYHHNASTTQDLFLTMSK